MFSDPARSRLKIVGRYAANLAILGGLAWGGKQLAASGMLSTLAEASPQMLAASFVAAAGAHLAAAGRWWSLAPDGHGYGRLARIQIEGHFWATFVPGGVAADGYRVLALRGRGSDTHQAAASVMLERVLGLVALLVLCGPALALGAHWLSSRLVISLAAFAGTASLMVILAAAAAVWGPIRRGRLRWLPTKVRSVCKGLEDAFAGYRHNPSRLVRSFAFALAYHGLFLAAYALAGEAMGLHLSLWRWFIAVPLTSLVATLPVNAWGIGVREGAIVLLLVALGASPAQAGAVSIAVVGLQLTLSCSGGLSQLVRRRLPATG